MISAPQVRVYKIEVTMVLLAHRLALRKVICDK